MVSEYILEEQFGGLFAGNVRCRWDKVSHLGQSVDGDENHVMAVRGYWEGSEIVHADGLPGSCWNRQRLKFAARFLGTGFRSLAGVTCLSMFPNVGAHAGPKVQTCNLGVGLEESGVSCDREVVVFVDNFLPVGGIWKT